MSNYDLTAISSNPDFYLSSNATVDQSGRAIYTLTNTATNTGQPIIVGNPSSWSVTSSNTIGLGSNPIFFRNDTSMEFVLRIERPTEAVCVFGDATPTNGLFVSDSGVELRFVDSGSVQKSVSIPLSIWPSKIHVVITFDSRFVGLQVNGVRAQVEYLPTDPGAVGAVTFKTSAARPYIIDGIGVYSLQFIPKHNMIDVTPFDYLGLVAHRYGSTGTRFDSYRPGARIKVNNAMFKQDPQSFDYYICTQTIPVTDEAYSSIIIENSDPYMAMLYRTNDSDWVEFVGRTAFVPSQEFYVLQLRIPQADISNAFEISIDPIFDPNISTDTPASLLINGPFFNSGTHETALVNVPRGVELDGSSYAGTWDIDSPRSIEIAFMPRDNSKTIVFESSEGSVSYGTGGSISGYTAYLNGVPAVDLSAVRINQWNQLVLTIDAPVATGFYLNSDSTRAGAGNIAYAYLIGYQNKLTSEQIDDLYKIATSSHGIRVVETTPPITEGNVQSGSPFSLYTFAWAIVGGGGS